MRDTYSSQWAAQFLTAGELSRQGYKVAILLGNAPGTDLLVESPNGVRFGVQCKGLKKKGFCIVKEHEVQELLYYILVFAPRDSKKKPQYFVMSCGETMDLVHAWMDEHPNDRKADVGFYLSAASAYEDEWGKLPK